MGFFLLPPDPADLPLYLLRIHITRVSVREILKNLRFLSRRRPD